MADGVRSSVVGFFYQTKKTNDQRPDPKEFTKHHDKADKIKVDMELSKANASKFDGVPQVVRWGAEPRNLNPKIVAGAIRKPFDIERLVETVIACLSTQGDASQLNNCPTARK
jgi:hypothetical protein